MTNLQKWLDIKTPEPKKEVKEALQLIDKQIESVYSRPSIPYNWGREPFIFFCHPDAIDKIDDTYSKCSQCGLYYFWREVETVREIFNQIEHCNECNKGFYRWSYHNHNTFTTDNCICTHIKHNSRCEQKEFIGDDYIQCECTPKKVGDSCSLVL